MSTTLAALLKSHDLDLIPKFNAGFIRNGAAWFTGSEATVNGKLIQWASFGDFSRDLSVQWNNTGGNITHEEQEKIDEFIRHASEENRREREAHWETTASAVGLEWNNYLSAGQAPYLERKEISGLYGCRIEPHGAGNRLIVPARDCAGRLWGYQKIYSEKLSGSGTDKIFRRGARKEACFHTIGPELNANPQTIYFSEGIATAISIAQALGETATVLSCFDAGNLVHCAHAVRSLLPNAHFIFAADNDCHAGAFGPSHTGEKKAREAADAVGNATVILPVFEEKDLGTRPTDFDDVRRLYGIDAVRKQIDAQLNKNNEEAKAEGQEAPGPKEKKKVGMSEAKAVRLVLEQYGPRLIKKEKDLFIFKDTHWHHMDANVASDYFKRVLDAMAKGAWKFKDISSAYSRLLIHIPTAPEGVDLFSPNPGCINLLNGTLHINQDKKNRKVSVEFKPHHLADYIINILPFKYDPSDMHFNEKLLGVIQNIFKDEADYDEKFYGIQEMYASTICGLFPMLFMLFGVPGTGKSTLANIARRLVGPKNLCQVPPTRWNNFHMWQMIGKLVNIDTDIPTSGKIQDDMIKKVIESIPVSIQRKNLSDVQTRLPSSNIFCANKLPPFVDGNTGAQDRRWLVFETRRVVIPDEEIYDQRYWDHVFDSDPQGVFNFALAGVKRLAERQGIYTASASSKEKVKEWQTTSDLAGKSVAEFLKDVSEGEVDDNNNIVLLDSELKIERKHLWGIFRKHYEGVQMVYSGPSKNEVYDALGKAGLVVRTIKGVKYFTGIGVKSSEGANV